MRGVSPFCMEMVFTGRYLSLLQGSDINLYVTIPSAGNYPFCKEVIYNERCLSLLQGNALYWQVTLPSARK